MMDIQYNTNLYIAQGRMRIRGAAMAVNRAMYCRAAENSMVFKRDLKEASEEADRRSGSREFHTDGTAVEQARDTKYKVTVFLTNRKADDDSMRLPSCQLL